MAKSYSSGKPKLYMGRPMGNWIFMAAALVAIGYLVFGWH